MAARAQRASKRDRPRPVSAPFLFPILDLPLELQLAVIERAADAATFRALALTCRSFAEMCGRLAPAMQLRCLRRCTDDVLEVGGIPVPDDNIGIRTWTELPDCSFHGEMLTHLHTCVVEMRDNWRFLVPSPQPGQLVEREFYNLGKKHGTQERWYANGNIHMRTELHHGDQHGLRQEWWPNGHLHTREIYDANIGLGVKEVWLESGEISDYFEYDDEGSDHGTRRRWDKNTHALIEDLIYVHGEHHGKQRTWYSNGQLRAVDHYRYGARIGLTERWYENGQKFLEHSYDPRGSGRLLPDTMRAWDGAGGELDPMIFSVFYDTQT